jgi:hypothetical protein
MNKTLECHEKILERHEQLLKDIRIELLEKAFHYRDRVLLQMESGVTEAGILRE